MNPVSHVSKMQELVRREERRPKLSTIARTVQAVENLRRDRLSLIAANQQASARDDDPPLIPAAADAVDSDSDDSTDTSGVEMQSGVRARPPRPASREGTLGTC